MNEPSLSRDPATVVAATIGAHWRELLGVETATPGDDFIGLGGNSILATMLANRIEDELGVRPQIVDLFTTLERIVALCEAMVREAAHQGAAS
jgi:acyl carrier protein